MAKLSVVVPFHNVEDYLGAALESVARQTFGDLEVIMVDDGSTDGSALIAKDYVARDPRFRLIQQFNAGPGPARNAGIRQATGEYLAFFDGDDLLDPHAYGLLTGSLEKTGSDIAAGGCTKFNSSGPIRSWLHEEPFRKTVLRTHVTRFPVLVQDRTTWNKVYRRLFWDENGFEFPGGLYEDPPVAIRSHMLASSVDVFHDVVYYWRVRDAGEFSTTERAREIGNIEQRMASVASVADFLAAHAPSLKHAFDISVLRGDFVLLVQAFEQAIEDERARIAELAAAYLSSVDVAAFRSIPVYARLTGYLLGQGMLPELLEVLRYARRDPSGPTPVVRRPGIERRWCAQYPFYGDPQRRIPHDIYDVTDQMTLHAGLDSVGWQGHKLRIEGHAYIHRLSSATPSECQIKVVLRNKSTRRTMRLRLTRVRRPDVTARSGQAAACYDWSGFIVEVDARRLATLPGLWRAANWELRVEVSGGGLRREGPISVVRPGSAQWPDGRWVARSVWLQPARDHDSRFVIRGHRVTAFVTECSAGEGMLEIVGWTSRPLATGAKLLAAPRRGGAAVVTVPAEPTPVSPEAGERGQSRHGFRASLPARELMNRMDAATLIDRIVHVHDEFIWDVSLDPGNGGPVSRLAIARPTTGARVAYERREVTAFATHFGSLSLLERTVRAVVTSLRWQGQRLTVEGNHASLATTPAELILRHVISGRQHALPLSWEGSTFRTEFVPAQMPSPAGPLPLDSGGWHVLTPTGPGGAHVAVAIDRRLLPTLPGYHPAGLHEVEAQPYHVDALRLHVRLARAEDERGPYAVRQLKAAYYPTAATAPIRDLAVFDSFSSMHYSCNPRAIYEELRRTHPDLECAWVTADGQFTVPSEARVIPANGRAHFDALTQARYVIVNDELPRWYRRRHGQTCLQTWHGTPLKRIGLDIVRPQFPSASIYHERVREASATWDILLSPNPFSTAIFRRAFGYDGEILEVGYPRNDLLYRPDRDRRAAAVRRQLGVPAGKRVILYAPTWRDNAARPSGGYRFDLQLDVPAMAKALGDDHLLLLRLHTKARNSPVAQISDPFVLPVTDYPDITDLLLITDVLITDYSSVMFDFAGTGRPILFHTYDLESYRDSLRGFYFNFEAEAPGPLLATTAELVDALRDIGTVGRRFQDAYQAFIRTYCPLDDGKAASRVVDRLLAGK